MAGGRLPECGRPSGSGEITVGPAAQSPPDRFRLKTLRWIRWADGTSTHAGCDRLMSAGDIRNHDVQPAAVERDSVHELGAQVDLAAGDLEHPTPQPPAPMRWQGSATTPDQQDAAQLPQPALEVVARRRRGGTPWQTFLDAADRTC